ncbi:hypothetical protein A0H81_05269 [Grifola frondosa]|uniref:Uncharacterized protein n=1 Tax=Grifola frondosa TaxID=5627 RepID=A0A1C7MD23_GRIFR|nr:hypothetical protein A0H81_05269 [Grifola frondosa]
MPFIGGCLLFPEFYHLPLFISGFEQRLIFGVSYSNNLYNSTSSMFLLLTKRLWRKWLLPSACLQINKTVHNDCD